MARRALHTNLRLFSARAVDNNGDGVIQFGEFEMLWHFLNEVHTKEPEVVPEVDGVDVVLETAAGASIEFSGASIRRQEDGSCLTSGGAAEPEPEAKATVFTSAQDVSQLVQHVISPRIERECEEDAENEALTQPAVGPEPAPEPGLASGWKTAVSNSTGLTYYVNTRTGASQYVAHLSLSPGRGA